jgi:phosphatidylglycerol:prolipoprotein diacylglycerol transferase
MVMGEKVHPTFLYESIWCLLLFFFLLWVDNRRKFKGQTALLYGMLYSAERFFVEALRTDSLMIGPFRQAQVLSLMLIVVCGILYIFLTKKQKRS